MVPADDDRSTAFRRPRFMTGALPYALAALVLFGIGDFIYKRATLVGLRADHLLMSQAWFFLPLIVGYGLVTGTLVLRLPALWGSLAGAFVFVGFYNFVRSLATGPVSVNAPVFRLNFVVTALLAIAVLGETLTGPKLAGLTLAFGATWLLLGARVPGERTHEDRGALLRVLLATVAFGMANFLHTVGLRQGVLPETMLAAQAVVFMPLTNLAVFAADRRVAAPREAWGYGAVMSLVLFGAFICLLHGISLGQASVVVPIAQMGFIVTAVLGTLLLGEPVTLRRVLGLAAAVAALVALTL
jgi:drug/metabolite transporter (DMT)-like permease